MLTRFVPDLTVIKVRHSLSVLQLFGGNNEQVNADSSDDTRADDDDRSNHQTCQL